VDKHKARFSILGIAGKFASRNRQITDTFDASFHTGQIVKEALMAF